MITSNIYTKVFMMTCGKGVGSCFAMEHDGRQYICTAKHNLKEFNGSSIELVHDSSWKKIDVSLVGNGSHNSDIAVLATNFKLAEPLPLDYTAGGVQLGQEIYFLGFPYMISTSGGNKLNRSFPLPLVKRGILSGSQVEGGASVFYLDGHNNKGFSGGPVVFMTDERKLAVASVISGYKSVYEAVLDENENETKLLSKVNTGIVTSYVIKHAIDAIITNPVGFQL